MTRIVTCISSLALLLALALPASATTTYHWIPFWDVCLTYDDDPICGGAHYGDETRDECHEGIAPPPPCVPPADHDREISHYINRVPVLGWCISYYINAFEWEGATISSVTSAELVPDYLCDELIYTPFDQDELFGHGQTTDIEINGVITYFTFAGFCFGADISHYSHETPHGISTGTVVNDYWLVGTAKDCKWTVRSPLADDTHPWRWWQGDTQN